MKELIVKKLIDLAITYIQKQVPVSNTRLKVEKDDLEYAIHHHLKKVDQWSSTFSFKDIQSPKSINDILPELNLTINAKKWELKPQKAETYYMKDLLSEPSHTIILGDPGAGKTTTLRYLCNVMLHEDFSSVNDNFSFPILVRFRDLDSKEGLFDHIANILGIKIYSNDEDLMSEAKFDDYRKKILSRIISVYLDELKVVICLDGFDELHPDIVESVLSEFREIVIGTSNCKIILTCRSGEFHYSIDNTKIYEIQPLTKNQIRTLTDKWLIKKAKINDFLNQIESSPYADTTFKPLTLAHLLSIYDKYGSIPDKPKTVYKKIINLLLEDWDLQRSVKRVTRYGNFERDRKAEFLAKFSYTLTRNYFASVFSTDQFEAAYNEICDDFDLPKDEVKKVTAEIESHTGLLVQSGYDKYEFAHKSLQEYLCAEYIVKLPEIPESINEINKMPHEYAVAVALSSNSSHYFSKLLLNRVLRNMIDIKFLQVFFKRILIEKPDFADYIIFPIAFLELYSSISYAISIRGDQIYEKNLMDKKVRLGLFIQFIKKTRLKGVFSNITNFYSFDHQKKYTVFQLRQNHELQSFNLSNYLAIDNEIFNELKKQDRG